MPMSGGTVGLSSLNRRRKSAERSRRSPTQRLSRSSPDLENDVADAARERVVERRPRGQVRVPHVADRRRGHRLARLAAGDAQELAVGERQVVDRLVEEGADLHRRVVAAALAQVGVLERPLDPPLPRQVRRRGDLHRMDQVAVRLVGLDLDGPPAVELDDREARERLGLLRQPDTCQGAAGVPPAGPNGTRPSARAHGAAASDARRAKARTKSTAWRWVMAPVSPFSLPPAIGLFVRAAPQAEPQPPPPGVSITNTSPGAISTLAM